MRILISPNAFKGSLTASQAAEAIAQGIRPVLPEARLTLLPLSDGGDGLVDVLEYALGGKRIFCRVADPLGRKIKASFLLLDSDGSRLTAYGSRIAVIELASASGLVLLKSHERNPLRTTTYGTGELIRKAMDHGARMVLVGLGGSATNDGGAGLLRALGVRFLDGAGQALLGGAKMLLGLAQIDLKGLDSRTRRVQFVAVTDVRNCLLGRLGCSRVYGPQKGASSGQVSLLEKALSRYARIIQRDLGKRVGHVPGGGAAGGTGAGMQAFLSARIEPGAPLVFKYLGMQEHLKFADWIITGEGTLDRQSFYGKAPMELAYLARKHRKPVVVLCGRMEKGLQKRLESLGVVRVYSLMECGERNSMRRAGTLLKKLAFRATRECFCF
ncbi:MAG: glycerate kinase [Elusimicrobia bacterium]|nr:glycerate kinase [Elusimicrobiota bacterium]